MLRRTKEISLLLRSLYENPVANDPILRELKPCGGAAGQRQLSREVVVACRLYSKHSWWQQL